MKSAAVFAHDAEDDRQTQAGADARRLGGKEWIEDARLDGLRNSGAIVADLQEHTLIGDASGLDADRAAFALLLDGLPGISNEVHEHLLELPSVALHEGKHGVEIELHVDVVGGEAEALEFEGAGDDLIGRHAAALGPRFPGGKQELAQDGAGPLRFLIDLAGFVGIAGGIAAQEEALRVAENAGERVTEFVSDAGDHLA